jgi:hypothetical protein
MLTRNDKQWAEYLELLKRPKYYADPLVARTYVYPMGMAGLFWGAMLHSTLLMLLLPIAIWLHPGKGERVFENRIKRVKEYQARAIVSLAIAVAIFAFS